MHGPMNINLLKPTGYMMYHQFNIQQLTLCPHCIYVFCIYLRTNSDFCRFQHKLIGFYNRDEKCLQRATNWVFNPLKPELNSICYLLALLGAHHFLHVSRIRVKLLTFRLLMSYIYGAPILDVSRSHTTTQHSR